MKFMRECVCEHKTTRCCRAAHAAYMRAYHQRNKDRINPMRKARGDWPRYKYGLTKQGVLEVFESSDGLCALCYEVPATVIDHDHETGKVRGALCHFCNKGLGYIEKMGATSPAIVEYLTIEWSAA